VRELVLGDHELAGVDEPRGTGLIEVGGDDQRGKPLAEARRHVERLQRAMPEQGDAVQRVAELGEQRVDAGAHRAAAAADQAGRGSSMAPFELVQHLPVARIAALGQSRALDQFVGHPLKGRHDEDDRLAPMGVEHDPADSPNPVWRGQRRSAELEHSHARVD
jgi:hypothetical protein